MRIFKKQGLKEKDVVDLVDKMYDAPPKRCDYCGKGVTSYMLSIRFQDKLSGTDDGRIVCWPCGFALIDALVHLLTGQTRKEET